MGCFAFGEANGEPWEFVHHVPCTPRPRLRAALVAYFAYSLLLCTSRVLLPPQHDHGAPQCEFLRPPWEELLVGFDPQGEWEPHTVLGTCQCVGLFIPPASMRGELTGCCDPCLGTSAATICIPFPLFSPIHPTLLLRALVAMYMQLSVQLWGRCTVYTSSWAGRARFVGPRPK